MGKGSGGSAKQAPSAGIDHLVFQGKSVDGFWLGPWLMKKNPLGILRTWRRAQALKYAKKNEFNGGWYCIVAPAGVSGAGSGND